MSTYTPIASVTLSSAQSSVTFSGIPQTYTDLVLIVNSQRTANANNPIRFRFNSDSGSNYSQTNLWGNGTSANSDRLTNTTYHEIYGLPTSTGWANQILNLQNYANTTTFKSTLLKGNNAGQQVIQIAGLWRNTNAITKIEIYLDADNMSSGSTFNLYGIANASITNVAKATGGDSVYTDGTYWYHIFRSSGTFTPTQALTADYLVVAGGGGGGSGSAGAGGGGAGGMRCTVTATGGGGSVESALSLTAQAYTVTVGAGGAGRSGSVGNGTSGSNSVFATITSTGGGYGANGANDGATGGSGGGAGQDSSVRNGGAGTTNQGYAGGRNISPADGNNQSGGGGGGAGAVGGNATGGSTGGNGGAGVATSISGTSTSFAGGGGGSGFYNTSYGTTSNGGTGGTGGGGNANTVGVANTGGGGGGGGGSAGGGGRLDGAAGGSGIVIVRYAA